MAGRRIAALGVALGMSLAAVWAPAAAQAQVSTTVAPETSIQRLAELQTISERVQRLAVGIVGDPVFSAADTPERMVAAIDALGPRIAAARVELQGIAVDLETRPALAADAQSDVAQAMTVEMAQTARQMDRLLADVQAIAAAVESGDRDRVGDLAQALAAGVVGLIDAQVSGLRGRAALMPPGGSAQHQILAMACFYEGYNAFNRAYFGMSTSAAAAASVDEAVTCMADRIGRARVALRAEKAQEAGRLGAAFDEFVGIRSAMQDRIDQARSDLAILGEGLARGRDLEEIARRFELTMMDFEADIIALNGREVDLAPRLPL